MSVVLAATRRPDGRWRADGNARRYVIECRGQDRWALAIFRTTLVDGQPVIDPKALPPQVDEHDTLQLAITVAGHYERLGNHYRKSRHEHRSRRAEANRRAYLQPSAEEKET